MKILIVAAHPDDEVLGCGGTILNHVQNGDEVYVCIVTEATKSLGFTKEEGEIRKNEALTAGKMLGVKKIFFLDFPSVKLDTVPRLEVIQKIGSVLRKIQPKIVYTHHAKDLNFDHRVVFHATIVAIRPVSNDSAWKVLSYEILSSPESDFSPNVYYDISKNLDKKIEIMGIYKSELKKYPHPRSLEGIKIRAKMRGMSVNMDAAEAFVLIRERL